MLDRGLDAASEEARRGALLHSSADAVAGVVASSAMTGMRDAIAAPSNISSARPPKAQWYALTICAAACGVCASGAFTAYPVPR